MTVTGGHSSVGHRIDSGAYVGDPGSEPPPPSEPLAKIYRLSDLIMKIVVDNHK